MNLIFGLVVLILIATIIALIWLVRRRTEERERAEAARAAAFVSGLGKTPAPAPGNPAPAPLPILSSIPAPVAPQASPTSDIALQKMLFEAAHKAGEAGEPALAIQLYARLLSRFPATRFAEPARAAAAALKKKLVKS